MDAYGNFTSLSDFVPGTRFLLVSRLDPDVVFGVKYETWPGSSAMVGLCAEVNRLSAGTTATSELTVFIQTKDYIMVNWRPPDGSGCAYPLTFSDIRGRPVDMNTPIDIENQEFQDGVAGEGPILYVDFVDGCWFALNNWDRSLVADIYESGTTVGNQIVCWPWNGGDNQIWRAQKLD